MYANVRFNKKGPPVWASLVLFTVIALLGAKGSRTAYNLGKLGSDGCLACLVV
jgi:hypothetical protein